MSDTVSLFVQRGRTVNLAGIDHGPGAAVTLPRGEGDFLTSRGFLAAEPPVLTSPVAVPNPAGIGLHDNFAAAQGPRYR